MAPPPPATVSLGERLKQLAQTLQFSWFIGHFTMLLAFLRYFISYITFNTSSGMAGASYRVAFVAAAATYGIVVYKGYVTRGLPQGGVPAMAMKLAGDENVQYLCMSFVWLCSRQIPLTLVPFVIYSFFHVATYSRTYLIPTIQPPQQQAGGGSPSRANVKQPPLAEAIGRFVKKYYDTSMGMVAALEMTILIRLVGTAFTFSSGSWVLLLVYFAFFRSRYSQSSFVQGVVAQTSARVDVAVSHQSTPDPVRQGWEVFKNLVRQVYDATDVKRYLGGYQQPGAAKKPQ